MAAAAPSSIVTVSEQGARRVAILLVTLGDEIGSAVLKQMAPAEVDAVVQQIAELGPVSEEDRRRVLQEFLMALGDGSQPRGGGLAAAERLLEKAFGPEAARARMEALMAQAKLEKDRRERMLRIPPEQLAHTLLSEHPQAIALFLASLPPTHASAVLAALPGSIRGPVAFRLATMQQYSPEMAEKVAATVEKKLGKLKTFAQSSYSGTQTLATLCNHLPPDITEEILSEMDEKDADLAESVRSSMFTFEDIQRLDPQTMALIAPRVERKQLTLALKGAGDEIKERFLQTMSQRARAMLLEDIEALGPVRMRDVAEAQRQIAALIRELDRSGVISIRAESTDQFV